MTKRALPVIPPSICGLCQYHLKSQLADECAYDRVEENNPKLAPRHGSPPDWCPLRK